MEVPPPISEGSLTKILEGKKVPQPTLMVLSLKKSSPYGKYHKQSSMMIGDGERYSGAIISPIMQKGLKANSIVTLKQYICAKSNGHDVIFVLDMKHYQEDEPPPPPPPPTIVDINPAPNTKLTRTTSRDQSNMNEEDENIPPKLHRGTSFGQGSRDSLFSPNTTQAQRELARELAKATANARNIEYGEDDEPILIHRTHSTGFYRSTKYIESDPFAEEDHDDEEEDDDDNYVHFMKRRYSLGAEKYLKPSPLTPFLDNDFSGRQSDEPAPPPPPGSEEAEKQTVVMRELRGDGESAPKLAKSKSWFKRKAAAKKSKVEYNPSSSSSSTISDPSKSPAKVKKGGFAKIFGIK